MNVLEQFLSKNTIPSVSGLPLIHSTRAFHLRSFQNSNTLKTTECTVFQNENLNYFFLGRPAYKYQSDVPEGAYWEYPCCFIFEYDVITDIKRVFPFDSGAFDKKLYPSYIKNMELEAFNVANVSGAPQKMIGAFFGSAPAYLKLSPKPQDAFIQENSLGVMDMEIKALHRLSLEGSASAFDDRRFSIEIQSGSDVDLTVAKPLAVVAPSDFFDDHTFRSHVEDVWQAEPISYPVFTLNISASYGQIYERVLNFYKTRGLL